MFMKTYQKLDDHLIQIDKQPPAISQTASPAGSLFMKTEDLEYYGGKPGDKVVELSDNISISKLVSVKEKQGKLFET
jgi:hypothetical protein